MVETDALDALVFNEVENLLHALHIIAGKGEAQTGFLPDFLAESEAADGAIECAFHAAELVMHGSDAIQRDTHVGHTQVLEHAGVFRGDACAVGGDGDLEPLFGGALQNLRQLGVEQGLASGEQQGIHFVICQVVNHGAALLPCELSRVAFGMGIGIAVYASQVAGAGDVPHYNGFAGSRGCGHAGCGAAVGQGAAVPLAVADMVGGLNGAGPELGDVDHDWGEPLRRAAGI